MRKGRYRVVPNEGVRAVRGTWGEQSRRLPAGAGLRHQANRRLTGARRPGPPGYGSTGRLRGN
jgi:hypothetical protein